MAEYIIQEETLIDIADAIREKEGGSGEVGPVNITWDGDTTGKLCFLMGGAYEYYKISDIVFSNEELKAGTATYVEETGTVKTVPFAEVWHLFQEAEMIGDEFTYLGEVLVLRDVSQSEFGEMFTNGEPETGTFFPKLNTEYTTNFTTTAAPGGGEPIPVPDFAPRILALSGGEQETPEIAVDENGLITATAGDKSATKQLSTQSGKTITPGPTEQIAVAAGKYVTGDIIVAAVQAGGYDDPYPVFNMNVDVPKVSMAVTAERYYSHALYNGVRLPRIPDSVLASYPYAAIRQNGSTENYDLVMNKTVHWYNGSALRGDYDALNTYSKWFTSPMSSPDSWTEQSHTYSGFTFDANRTCLWANHDIPNGSADATDIYFEGTDPVPVD